MQPVFIDYSHPWPLSVVTTCSIQILDGGSWGTHIKLYSNHSYPIGSALTHEMREKAERLQVTSRGQLSLLMVHFLIFLAFRMQPWIYSVCLLQGALSCFPPILMWWHDKVTYLTLLFQNQLMGIAAILLMNLKWMNGSSTPNTIAPQKISNHSSVEHKFAYLMLLLIGRNLVNFLPGNYYQSLFLTNSTNLSFTYCMFHSGGKIILNGKSNMLR